MQLYSQQGPIAPYWIAGCDQLFPRADRPFADGGVVGRDGRALAVVSGGALSGDWGGGAAEQSRVAGCRRDFCHDRAVYLSRRNGLCNPYISRIEPVYILWIR